VAWTMNKSYKLLLHGGKDADRDVVTASRAHPVLATAISAWLSVLCQWLEDAGTHQTFR
jgi:hypothetical protein